MKHLIPLEVIEHKILIIRGHRVMLDRDLAELYEVSTKVLNQVVKRNLESFPEDFMFCLNETEKKEVVTIFAGRVLQPAEIPGLLLTKTRSRSAQRICRLPIGY